ncbi:copia protein [Tanacetum coccineum]
MIKRPSLEVLGAIAKMTLETKPTMKLVCLRTCLEPDEWIKDSGCSKHMTGNKSLFSTYKAYDGGTNWVFGNKLDENGIVSRNKARLVAQGYNQQEGMDYDKTYAHGFINEEVYVAQPPGFIDFQKPNYVYNLIITVQNSGFKTTIVPSTDMNAPSLQEFKFLFGPLFKEYFTARNESVSKSSALSDNSKQQDKQPTTNVQHTSDLIIPPSNNSAEDNM